MVKIVSAMELKPIGVINKLSVSRELNQDIGSYLHLHNVRTDLDLLHFEKLFFSEGMDGDYLRRCCGKENVYLRIIKYPFRAVHCVAGWRTDKKKLQTFFEKTNWSQSIFPTSHLLSIDEIEAYAINPFKYIAVRNYGEINSYNIKDFKQFFLQHHNIERIV